MAASNRLRGLSPKAWALAACLAAWAGLAAIVVGIASGWGWPPLVAAYAVVFGANLVPSIADWRAASADVEAIRRQEKERAMPSGPPSQKEVPARIMAYDARLEDEPASGSGRFQERLSLQRQPGRDRLH